MSARIQKVPVGQEANLAIRLSKVPNGTAATFTIYNAADDQQIGEPVDGVVERGEATTIWTAEGPDPEGEPDQRVMRVYFTCQPEGFDDKVVSSELVVYLDTLELETVDEEDAVMPDAAYRVIVGREELPSGDTGSKGKKVIENLGDGELSVEFASPMRMVEWVEQKAGRWKAKLTTPATATIVSPGGCCRSDGPEATAKVHKQYVNLQQTADAPEKGSRVRVRVKFAPPENDPEAKVGKAGEELFCKLEYPGEDQLSARRVSPRRGFPAGSETEASAALEVDGGEVAFDVELGEAGGDWVLVKVGATEACEDDAIKIVNWRRIAYQLAHPDHMVPFALDRAAEQLAAAYVEFVQDGDAIKFTQADMARVDPVYGNGWVPTEAFERAVRDAPGIKIKGPEEGGSSGDVRFLLGTQNFAFFARDEWFQAGTDPKVSLVLGDAIYNGAEIGGGRWLDRPPSERTEIVKDTVIGTEATLSFEGRLFAADLRDGKHPLVRGLWKSTAPEGHPDHGKRGLLDESCLQFESGSTHLTVVLPSAGPEDPGSLVGPGLPDGSEADPADPGTRYPVLVVVMMRAAFGPWGGVASTNLLWVVNQAYDEVNQFVVHELGHAMKQAPRPTGPTTPDPDLDIGDHEFHYEKHGHLGPHCRYQLDEIATHVVRDGVVEELGSDKASDEPYYDDLRKLRPDGSVERAGGICSMYGWIWTDGGKVQPRGGFCEVCLPFVKGASLSSIG
jgi:hypothetical protein